MECPCFPGRVHPTRRRSTPAVRGAIARWVRAPTRCSGRGVGHWSRLERPSGVTAGLPSLAAATKPPCRRDGDKPKADLAELTARTGEILRRALRRMLETGEGFDVEMLDLG